MSLPNKHIRTQKLDDIPRDIYATVEDVFDKRLENEFSNQSSYQCSDIYKVKPQCLDSFIEKFFTHQSKVILYKRIIKCIFTCILYQQKVLQIWYHLKALW